MGQPSVVEVGDGFWNLRAPMKIGGVLDVRTHASLVRRRSGKYLLLDACAISPEARRLIDEQTNGGEALEAMLHLHPFHTLFVRKLHEAYPGAKLYGTARHRSQAPDLAWQPETTDQPDLHALFAEDLTFSVPRGVDFIPENQNLHFSSVLAFHPASRTLHVDDTLNYVRFPWPIRVFKADMLGLHPSLPRVLERRAGAARDFRAWTEELVLRVRPIENLCAAHTSFQVGRAPGDPPLHARVEAAVRGIEPKLAAHERRWG